MQKTMDITQVIVTLCTPNGNEDGVFYGGVLHDGGHSKMEGGCPKCGGEKGDGCEEYTPSHLMNTISVQLGKVGDIEDMLNFQGIRPKVTDLQLVFGAPTSYGGEIGRTAVTLYDRRECAKSSDGGLMERSDITPINGGYSLVGKHTVMDEDHYCEACGLVLDDDKVELHSKNCDDQYRPSHMMFFVCEVLSDNMGKISSMFRNSFSTEKGEWAIGSPSVRAIRIEFE